MTRSTGVTTYAMMLALCALVVLVAVPLLGEAMAVATRAAAGQITLETVAQGRRIVQLPPLTEHAKKHPEAEEVRRLLSEMDTRFCRYICGNRTYYACAHPADPKRWLFAVVEEGVATVTAFFTSQGYAVSKTRDNPGCKPFINAAHP